MVFVGEQFLLLNSLPRERSFNFAAEWSVQGLTPADLEAAWDYATAHPEEMDQAIQLNAEA